MSDPDGDLNPLTFTPTQGHDALDLSGDDIIVADALKLDYETDQTIELKGYVSDGTFTDDAVLTIHLNNLNDNVPVMDAVNIDVPERETNGTVVAIFAATDADGDLDPISYSFVSGKDHPAFSISGNELIVADGSELDFETEPSITMQVSISDGTHTSTADINVTVTDVADDKPSITAQPQSVEVCEGDNATLNITAEGNGTLSYDWLKNGVSLGKPDDVSLVLDADEIDGSASYSCKVTNEFGEDVSINASVTVRQLPAVDIGDDMVITTTQSVTLDAGSGFDSYLWSDNSTDQTMLFEGSVYDVGIHNVSVTVSDDLGCENSDEVSIEVTTATSVDQKMMPELSIYPNPVTSGFINIRATGIAGLVNIEVMSMSGQIIKVLNKFDLSGIRHIDLQDVSKGMYLIRIFNENYQKTEKIIIK